MLLTPGVRWGVVAAITAVLGLVAWAVGVREENGVPWLRFRGWRHLPETVQSYETLANDGMPMRVHYFGRDTLASVEYDIHKAGEYDCREDFESERVVAVYRKKDSGWHIDIDARTCR